MLWCCVCTFSVCKYEYKISTMFPWHSSTRGASFVWPECSAVAVLDKNIVVGYQTHTRMHEVNHQNQGCNWKAYIWIRACKVGSVLEVHLVAVMGKAEVLRMPWLEVMQQWRPQPSTQVPTFPYWWKWTSSHTRCRIAIEDVLRMPVHQIDHAVMNTQGLFFI